MNIGTKDLFTLSPPSLSSSLSPALSLSLSVCVSPQDPTEYICFNIRLKLDGRCLCFAKYFLTRQVQLLVSETINECLFDLYLNENLLYLNFFFYCLIDIASI